jgi:hypothetical protein
VAGYFLKQEIRAAAGALNIGFDDEAVDILSDVALDALLAA